MMEALAPQEPDPDEFPRSACGCGLEILYTPDGWEHDCADWFVGDGHQAAPTTNEAKAEALRYVVDHCQHLRSQEPPSKADPRCADCGIPLVNDGGNGWLPAPGAIPWRKDD